MINLALDQHKSKTTPTVVEVWGKRPMESYVKINFYAAVFSDDRAAGIGIVARNSIGEFLWAASLPFNHTQALVVEGLCI